MIVGHSPADAVIVSFDRSAPRTSQGTFRQLFRELKYMDLMNLSLDQLNDVRVYSQQRTGCAADDEMADKLNLLIENLSEIVTVNEQEKSYLLRGKLVTYSLNAFTTFKASSLFLENIKAPASLGGFVFIGLKTSPLLLLGVFLLDCILQPIAKKTSKVAFSSFNINSVNQRIRSIEVVQGILKEVCKTMKLA